MCKFVAALRNSGRALAACTLQITRLLAIVLAEQPTHFVPVLILVGSLFFHFHFEGN